MSSEPQINRFRIAFSFAGEKRDFVEATAQILAQCFGKEQILYDQFHEAEFARYDLGTYLPKLYAEQSELIVPVLCADYDPKRWTGWEWLHIYGLLTKADGHRVMPSRFDYANVDGLSPAAGYIELDGKTPQQFAELILTRLALNEGKNPDSNAAAQETHLPNLDPTQNVPIKATKLNKHISKVDASKGKSDDGLKLVSSDIPPLSCLYNQLKKITSEVVSSPNLHNHPFLLALAGGDSPVAVADIYRHCCERDPSSLLWDISRAVKQANEGLSVKNGFGIGRVSDLVTHMCLIAAARWISQKEIGKAHWVNDLPSMAMTEELAAAVVAAVWFDQGLQLRYNSDGKIEIVNLICDRAEIQFDFKTGEQAFDDEIYARVSQELSVTGQVVSGKPHPDDVKAGIDKLADSTGARLILGLGTADARQNVDGSLRNRIKERWGIELFVFADMESQKTKDIREEWASMQTSLLGHFERTLSPLFTDNSPTIVTTGDNPMPRSKVFISYAHARLDKNRLKALVEHLTVLENQGLVDIWDDHQIGAGQDWYDEIDRQLQSCKVAVFLVSPAFLGSKFISTVEVPTLLSRHQQQGMHVVPLLIRPCAWQTVSWLEPMQIRPSYAEPLPDKTRKRDEQLAQVALEIAGFCK